MLRSPNFLTVSKLLRETTAYTMVELIVAMAIMLVLGAGLVYISYDSRAEKVEVDKRKLELIRQQVESYKVKNDAYPTQINLATPSPTP